LFFAALSTGFSQKSNGPQNAAGLFELSTEFGVGLFELLRTHTGTRVVSHDAAVGFGHDFKKMICTSPALLKDTIMYIFFQKRVLRRISQVVHLYLAVRNYE